MNVKNWHPGQVVMLWVGAAILFFVLLVISSAAEPSTTISISPDGRRFGDPTAVQLFVFYLSTLLLFALPFVPVIITWRWFGARPLRDGTTK